MIKVNSKKTVNQLALSSFRANKLRNIFAIVLTTILFTGLFTVASSLNSSMEESTMRQVGGSFHCSLKYLTVEQYDKLKTHKSIREIFYTVHLGIAENKELVKRTSEIRYTYDEINARGMFSLPTTGRLPQNDDELATDTIVLEALGIPAELGQKVTLEYSVSGEKQSDTFTLVGFWQGDKLMSASQIWLNRSYVEKQLENYIPHNEYDFVGKINAEVNFANSINIEAKMLKLMHDCGYAPDEISYGVNWAYTGNSDSADMGTIFAGSAIILIIAFCGYLIISNVFYISVAKDIRYYGLLKTIGTTGRQIRYLIYRQALLLCLAGVPAGLLAGCFVGANLTPMVLSIMNTNVIKFQLNPTVFVASALFTVLTVLISITKPSKMAERVSPIEALRSTDGKQKSNKTVKKSGGISLWKMALDNALRNKKKAVLVTVSLSLSLIILNLAYSMANSFDMDKYLSNKIGSDFVIGDVSCFNVHIFYTNQDTLNSELIDKLEAMQGIEKMSSIYFAEPLTAADPRFADIPEQAEKVLGDSNILKHLKEEIKAEKFIQHIYGIDDNVWERFTVFEGEIDIEKLKTGNYVIAAPYHDSKGKVKYYNVGEKVEITNEDGAVKEYEVLAVAEIPFNISIQHFHPIAPELYLADNVFLQNISNKSPMLLTLDIKEGYREGMESFLSDYCQNINSNMQYMSKASLAAEYENTKRTYKSVGSVISLLVAFIGVMNFVNTVVTSIMSRKRELAMLQSIGMTNRQTKRMLIYEGLVYTVLTAVFALTIGSVFAYFSLGAFTAESAYLSLNFTVFPAILCLPLLAFISMLVPYISERVINKSSVVERLREAE